MLKRTWLVILIATCLLMVRCSFKENIIPSINYNYEYYPLKVGNYIVYDVTDTLYQFSRPPAPSKYQLKYLVADTFFTLGNKISYKLDIYRRNTSQDLWQIDSVWNVALENIDELVLTQSNIKKVKLRFPIKENEKWNVNKYNNSKEFLYQYKNVFKSYELDTKRYNKTLKVLIENDIRSITSFNDVYEIYAEDIGLIELHLEKYEYDQSSNVKKILTGLYRSMIINSSGNE